MPSARACWAALRSYIEWSGASDQRVVVPWTVLEQPEDALGFAVRLAQSPTRRAEYTSLSGAIDFSARLLQVGDLAPARRVIDISGDGPNNQGSAVTEARDEAVSRGITINGLPIMLKQSGDILDFAHLDLYFRDYVIGGPGAFMIPIHQRHDFAEAIKTKIVREISDLGPREPRFSLPTLPLEAAHCTGRGIRSRPIAVRLAHGLPRRLCPKPHRRPSVRNRAVHAYPRLAVRLACFFRRPALVTMKAMAPVLRTWHLSVACPPASTRASFSRLRPIPRPTYAGST